MEHRLVQDDADDAVNQYNASQQEAQYRHGLSLHQQAATMVETMLGKLVGSIAGRVGGVAGSRTEHRK